MAFRQKYLGPIICALLIAMWIILIGAFPSGDVNIVPDTDGPPVGTSP